MIFKAVHVDKAFTINGDGIDGEALRVPPMPLRCCQNALVLNGADQNPADVKVRRPPSQGRTRARLLASVAPEVNTISSEISTD